MKFFLSLLAILTINSLFGAGPIVIDNAWVLAHGSTVTGNFVGTTTDPAIHVTTTHPIRIINSSVSGPKDLIKIEQDSSVSVLNTIGTGTNPNVLNAIKGSFVYSFRPLKLIVKNCTATGVYYGVNVVQRSGLPSSPVPIRISGNYLYNIDGRKSDGNGGYITSPLYQATSHAVQINNVQGVPGIDISWNQIINYPYQGYINDAINIFQSSGTSTDVIDIYDNYVQGVIGLIPGDYNTGVGIITDGNCLDTLLTATAWVYAHDNQVVQVAHGGIAMAAGHDNLMSDNRVVSCGVLADGTRYASEGVGMEYIDSYCKSPNIFFNNCVKNNLIGFIRYDTIPSPAYSRFDYFFQLIAASSNPACQPCGQPVSLNCQGQVVSNLHFLPNNVSAPTVEDEEAEFTYWQDKVSKRRFLIGVLLPPAALIGKQRKNNVGLQYELANELRWTASPSFGVTGYFVYRDGKKIATLDASTLSYVDHNRKKGAAFYSVTSFNDIEYESYSIDVEVK